jgi:DNA polymerase III delta subunit
MGFSEDRASGRFGPFYFLAAENPYLLWEAVEHWKGVWRHAVPGVNVRVFTAPHVDLDRLLELGTTVPLFETLQLIVVEQVDHFPEGRLGGFVDILRRFGSSTKALLTAGTIDRRKAFYKTLANANLGPSEVFPRIYNDDVPGWVRRLAGEFDWTLSPQAVELLAGVQGTDLFAVRQTIERATLYIGQRRRIEAADIEAVIAGDGEHDIYLLMEAIGAEDLSHALGIMRSLLASGDRTLPWLAQITGQCLRLLKLLELSEESDQKAGQVLGIHPFLVRRLRPQAQSFGVGGLAATMEAVFETDWATKTSTLPTRLAWELLVWRLAEKNRRRAVWFDLENPNIRE